MKDHRLERIRQLILDDQYELSDYVQGRIEMGEYEEGDIESAILKGAIVRVQRDELQQSLDGNKYVISGPDRAGLAFQTVGKIVQGHECKEYFVITAYKER